MTWQQTSVILMICVPVCVMAFFDARSKEHTSGVAAAAILIRFSWTAAILAILASGGFL